MIIPNRFKAFTDAEIMLLDKGIETVFSFGFCIDEKMGDEWDHMSEELQEEINARQISQKDFLDNNEVWIVE